MKIQNCAATVSDLQVVSPIQQDSPEQEESTYYTQFSFTKGCIRKREIAVREHTGETIHKPEKKHFDLLASVRRYEYDSIHFGHITEPTKEQVLNEELSYIAEGLNRVLKTSFTLDRDKDGSLRFAASGGSRPYKELLDNGIEAAVLASNEDGRKKFLVTRAMNDHWHGQILNQLRPGQSYVWVSPYDQAVEDLYGAEFLSNEGFFPERKMGFIYRAYGLEDGSIDIVSQTTDNSDLDAYMAVLDKASTTPDGDMSLLLAVYDGVLAEKYGRRFVAGKPLEEAKACKVDVWSFILSQSDLIDYLHTGLVSIAHSTIEDKTDAVKLHIYGVWAVFKERLDKYEGRQTYPTVRQQEEQMTHLTYMTNTEPVALIQQSIQKEVEQARQRFIERGEIIRGCGGVIKIHSESSLFLADAQSVFESIFFETQTTNQEDEEEEAVPEMIQCANRDCRQLVATKDVVKKDSWRCPCCHYEVDICTGKVINSGKVLSRSS